MRAVDILTRRQAEIERDYDTKVKELEKGQLALAQARTDLATYEGIENNKKPSPEDQKWMAGFNKPLAEKITEQGPKDLTEKAKVVQVNNLQLELLKNPLLETWQRSRYGHQAPGRR